MRNTDITERKLDEEAVRNTEEKFRRVVENSLSGMYFYYLNQRNQLILTGSNPMTDKILNISIADKNMLDTILRNLISNSIKFSVRGSKVSITAIDLNDEVHISVSDNGTGIPPEKISAIFEMDKRTNTVGTEKEQGTGLGLVLCKDFIDRLGGKIWVKSIPNNGSTFTFSLPLQQIEST